MATKITFWVSTGLIAAISLFAAFAYLSGSPQAVQGFAHVGYPQQLCIILGVAKPLGAILLVVPGLAKLKEWAYAGFTFAWISAFIAHNLAKDGPMAFAPLVVVAPCHLVSDTAGKPHRLLQFVRRPSHAKHEQTC